MTYTPASRRAYRRALNGKAPEASKVAPGTPNGGLDEYKCVLCDKPVEEDDASEDRPDLHENCRHEYAISRAEYWREEYELERIQDAEREGGSNV